MSPKNMPIAIVGISAIFPGSPDLEHFWQHIFAGNSLIQAVPRTHWLKEDYYQASPGIPDKVYAYNGAFLPDTPFDPVEFGIPPKLLTSIDTAQLFALIATRNLLADINSVRQEKIDRKKMSVILGVAAGTELMVQMSSRIQQPIWAKVLREAGLPEDKVQQLCANIANQYVPWNEATFPGLLSNVVAGRVANRFDLGGTNCVIDAACASSLASIKMAVAELRLHEADLVITGGVDTFNDVFMYMCFSQTPALSLSGNCRPFSAAADGTILGEGVGLVGLRRLEDAEKDGDKIYAIINAIGSSSDGKMKSIYAPSAAGQAQAIKRTYAQVNYSLADVELMEAHGTGTKAGDSAEFNGLKLAFDEVAEKQFCALGSIKSQIGHTKSTAGAASIIKMALALNHKVLPPTINIDKPNPNLALTDSAFYLNTRSRPWPHAASSTRKASVSSFGFGGSNFHVALEEYVAAKNNVPRFYNSPVNLLLISAANQQELLTKLTILRSDLPQQPLPLLAKKAQSNFVAAESCRLAVLVQDTAAGLHLFDQFENLLKKDNTSIISLPGKFYYATSKQTQIGKVAFLFPGQGSQYLNMTADLAMLFETVRAVYDQALTLPPAFIKALAKLIFPIPVFTQVEEEQQLQELTQTQWAQPAIGLSSSAILALLKQLNVHADCYAGHSYGELTALYAAGVFDSLSDFLMASHERGNLMAKASANNTGAMLAVAGEESKLRDLLKDKIITFANINSAKQIVLSGDVATISEIEALLRQNNISCKKLNVANAFHTNYVSDAAQQFYDYLSTVKLNKSSKPVYANTTAKIYPKTIPAVRKLLAEQLANPVHFRDQLLQMYADGARVFVEVGPGNVLSRFVEDTLPKTDCVSVAFDRKGQPGLISFWEALAKLAIAGIEVDFQSLWNNFHIGEAIDGKTKSAIMINGANIGKPYPAVKEQSQTALLNGASREGISSAKTAMLTSASLPSKNSVHVIEEKLTNENLTSSTTEQPRSYLEEGENFMSTRKSIDTNDWLTVLQTMQANMLEAQKSFQALLLQSHTQFLHTSEVFLQQLAGLDTANGNAQMNTARSIPAIALSPQPKGAESIVPKLQQNNLAELALSSVAETPVSNVPTSATDYAIATMRPAPTIAPTFSTEIPEIPANKTANTAAITAVTLVQSAATTDHQALLLKAVAEKTGYPQEMLEINMDLESDLGIDSIKRVEILSALQADIPELKNADTSELSSLRTLMDILNYAEKLTGSLNISAASAKLEENSKKKLADAVL